MRLFADWRYTMICSICGGRVEWQGPLSNLTHTKCLSCGEINCQEVDPPQDDEADESDAANTPVDHREASGSTNGSVK